MRHFQDIEVTSFFWPLQQHLPLAVLKPNWNVPVWTIAPDVATALTACGIETIRKNAEFFKLRTLQQHLPLAVLKLAKGIFAPSVA